MTAWSAACMSPDVRSNPLIYTSCTCFVLITSVKTIQQSHAQGPIVASDENAPLEAQDETAISEKWRTGFRGVNDTSMHAMAGAFGIALSRKERK